ncbi:PTS system, lactose/cellobiose family IIC subunit [Ethanoligenens harbinense YUAN-3]|uniref:Permease IIC component n=2 Tax=Ethanoligenens harbinense TaxID=253239 RepID=E6U3C0_ETHHY|nr:PTS system, lactose/cellobiose family IIC subunit [Ethanoligenens harbinense YUAN-3]AVQ97357.1 PTS sugar transporter subunit IIC [Ethanoligenens harbinense YUAN-3]AYF40016.1 PTS sugar transporter subunit IIC [Ethanoligenens harbinense]AYF42847.1 PTS sugar transporter subunit IIC [Ethanoligenens harbinense]QCN93604.1 PTS sugar transporter subunit IIC [Ethanoligenens harbinense]
MGNAGAKAEKMSFIDKFTIFAQKLGAQVHLRSLRDAFATAIPIFILAGIAVLINNVVLLPTGFLSHIISPEVLTTWQGWGNTVTNATLSLSSPLIAVAIAYHLSMNKRFDNPIAAVIGVFACTMAMLPLTAHVTPLGATKAIAVSGAIAYAQIGTQAMFTGIIVGLVGTELFMALSRSKKLRINLGDNIPPAVSKSFNMMIPTMLLISIFAFGSFLIQAFLHTDFVSLVAMIIQEPLRRVNTSLPGYLLILSCANLLFTFGIHQAVLSGSLLDPLLLINMNLNTAAYAAHHTIPTIINTSFHNTFGLIGGSGCTLSLLIAVFVFGRSQVNKDVGKLAIAPGLFNINEPVIFGLPIVFNIPMIIPFILAPVMGTTIAYFATALHLISPCVIFLPWTTPPLIAPFLATAGDWRAVVLQVIVIALQVMLYLPFLKISERIQRNEMEMIEKEKTAEAHSAENA